MGQRFYLPKIADQLERLHVNLEALVAVLWPVRLVGQARAPTRGAAEADNDE
jgi:hypothetical protein